MSYKREQKRNQNTKIYVRRYEYGKRNVCTYNEQTNPHLTDSLVILFFIYRSYMFQRQRVILRKLLLGQITLSLDSHYTSSITKTNMAVRDIL
jgi:hypothetical protein